MRTATVVLVAGALLASVVACSGDEQARKQSARRGDPATAQVSDSKDTSVVSPSGARATIPAGAATAGTLTIADSSPRNTLSAPASTLDSGQPVDVTLDGGELTGEATIEFPLTPEQATAVPIVERFNEQSGVWEPLPIGDITVDSDSVAVRTTHFSWYRPSWLSKEKVAQWVRDRWFDVFGDGLAGAERPTCPRDPETLNQIKWSSSPDDTLFWCVGTNDDGTTVVNVVNNNRYPMSLDVSKNLVQLGKWGGSGLAESLGAAFEEWGSGQVILQPREGVTFRLADGVSGRYRLASDFTLLTWSIGMLGVAISTYIDMWTKAGTHLDTATKKIAFALDASACVHDMGQRLLSDPGLWTATREMLIYVFDCAGEVFKQALSEEGLWIQWLAEVVAFVTGTVIGGFEGLVALGEISLDSLKKRATYDLSFAPRPASSATTRPGPASTSVDLQQVAAGNYDSLAGTWTEVANAVNPKNGTGYQWESGGNDTVSISRDAIVFNGYVVLRGSTLSVDVGGDPQTYPLSFRDKGGFLEASLVDEQAPTNWGITFYPKGSADLNSELQPNNGIAFDNSRNTIALWVSNNGAYKVFAQA